MPAIFISHSSLDQQIAKDIKTALDQFGFPDPSSPVVHILRDAFGPDRLSASLRAQ